jgi:hypothetical protein
VQKAPAFRHDYLTDFVLLLSRDHFHKLFFQAFHAVVLCCCSFTLVFDHALNMILSNLGGLG